MQLKVLAQHIREIKAAIYQLSDVQVFSRASLSVHMETGGQFLLMTINLRRLVEKFGCMAKVNVMFIQELVLVGAWTRCSALCF
jgi:hypothetical protein